MKVFISWSGERSRLVAELLDDWIQCVIQAVDPWMSSKDIDRGALWFSEISDELANTSVGIVCLTKENKDKPWILFESGALAKGLSSNRVCTFLIDLESTDLENPLAQFNHTVPTRIGLFQLVRTINLSLQSLALNERVLEKVFDTYWPQFEERFAEIISSTPDIAIKEKRRGDDILIEVLSSIRSMDRRLLTMEQSSLKKTFDEDTPIGATRRLGTAIRVKQLLQDGYTDDQVLEKLARAGYSKDYIRTTLHRERERGDVSDQN